MPSLDKVLLHFIWQYTPFVETRKANSQHKDRYNQKRIEIFLQSRYWGDSKMEITHCGHASAKKSVSLLISSKLSKSTLYKRLQERAWFLSSNCLLHVWQVHNFFIVLHKGFIRVLSIKYFLQYINQILFFSCFGLCPIIIAKMQTNWWPAWYVLRNLL